MKIARIILSISILLTIASTMTSCGRSRDQVWDDTKSCGRHVKRGVYALGGYHQNSRMVNSRDEFYGSGDAYGDSDYTGFSDASYGDELAMGDYVARQPQESPGDPGSSIPGIDAFRDASSIPGLSGIFRTIYFGYDSSLIKGEENLSALRAISDYMRSHPNLYIFIEGHCCDRGAEAYNLSLGSRRANSVRNILIQDGVSPDNVFTISYGKERPAVSGPDESSWSKNRRVEFKIYQQ